MEENRSKSKFFDCDKVLHNTYRIKGLGNELCYLVLGQKRALLIDGLSGIGSLMTYVKNLTDLPVTLVLTHGHRDHSGAAWEIGECFLHPDDIPILYDTGNNNTKDRFDYVAQSDQVKQGLVTYADVIPDKSIKTYPVYDGDIFDLGDEYIEVISVPGHTYGSIVFLDRRNRVVYSGDACNLMTLIGLYGCATVEEYRDGLFHFKKFQKYFDVCYGGHEFFPVKNSVIDDAIMLCSKILKGTDDSIEMHNFFADIAWLAARKKDDIYPQYGGDANILYDKVNIRKRMHPMIKGKPNLYK